MTAARENSSRTRRDRGPGDLALAVASGLAVAAILAMLFLILFEIVHGGAGRISWEFLSTAPRKGGLEGGIWPAIFGTMLLVLVMTVVAAPVGVATAVYLSEYARPGAPITRFIRAAVANLAGVPAISLPTGTHSNGLPFGIQLTAAPFAEAKLLNVAHWYQRETEWHKRIPQGYE